MKFIHRRLDIRCGTVGGFWIAPVIVALFRSGRLGAWLRAGGYQQKMMHP